jgi:hypothetical protein
MLAAVVMERSSIVDEIAPEQLDAMDAEAYWYVRGVLAARSAWPGGRNQPLSIARQAADRLETLAANGGRWSRTEVRRALVHAAIAGAQEEREQMSLYLSHAGELDAQLRGAGLHDDEILPFEELAGDLWLQVHRFHDAMRHYRTIVSRQPQRTRAWIGLARAAREAGGDDEARPPGTCSPPGSRRPA